MAHPSRLTYAMGARPSPLLLVAQAQPSAGTSVAGLPVEPLPCPLRQQTPARVTVYRLSKRARFWDMVSRKQYQAGEVPYSRFPPHSASTLHCATVWIAS
jgi:hypothetical protein